MHCDKCGKKTVTQKIVVNSNEVNQWCPACIVSGHKQFMRRHKCDLLYLYPNNEAPTHVTDFSGHMKIPLTRVRVSSHNFAGANSRVDLWFEFEDRVWYGIHIGHKNTHATCRETKRRARRARTQE